MRFRPCIDIHNGRVKQIVGSSLRDRGNCAEDNFVSDKNADYYASMYCRDGLYGGHIILLNPAGSEYYEEDCRQAALALRKFPGGMQIGGGINEKNAANFIEMGASHVIVTSYVFRDGKVDFAKNPAKIEKGCGKETYRPGSQLQAQGGRLLYRYRQMAEIYGCTKSRICYAPSAFRAL